MKTFFESYCADNNKTVEQIHDKAVSFCNNKDFNQFYFKIQYNPHDFGDYDTLDIYIKMIEPDEEDEDDYGLWNMYIEQAKQLTDYLQDYIYE